MDFTLKSNAFEAGETIPTRYTCDGEDVSPPLEWTDPPEETVAFALICDDPDAPRGTWTHWVLYNIPADFRLLREGVPTTERLNWGGIQGRNDFGQIGYGGPCPPRGPAHRYYFRLFALDEQIDLPAGATRQEVLRRIHGHILAEAELMGRYARR